MIETKMLPTSGFKGLYLDGVTVPGGMSKAENVYILPDGSAERRLFQRTLTDTNACQPGKGLKDIYELRKSDGTRYLFSDIDNPSTATISYGAELITNFASWTDPGAAWSYGTGKWSHATGTTALVATGEPAIVAGTKYRVVVGVTQTPPSGSGGGWAFTAADSGAVWTGPGGDTHPIWNLKWTHTAAGGTTALTALRDFSLVDSASYRVYINVTHTAGTSLTVYMGQTIVGTITSTGQHELIVTFVDLYTAAADLYKNALRFVPTNDWAGSINVDWFPGVSPNNATISVKKMVDPAGANIPSNYESYDFENGLVDIGWPMSTWYAEETAQVSQALSVSIGGASCGVITASGVYTYDTTAIATTALTFTPTTAWPGTINSVSVKIATIDTLANTKMKIIGGTVTGTSKYEITWGTIKSDLISGATVVPMWATMQNMAFRVDGTNINYYFKDASAAHTIGVASPVDAPVCASATGGELTPDTYSVWYTYVKKDGEYVVESNPSPSTTLVVAGVAIDVNVIGNVDTDITHIRIYRTLYNELGSDAYLAMEVLNYTQTAKLIKADDVIGDGTVLEYTHDMPKRAMFVLTGGSRLWMLRFPSEVGGDSMMMWSDVGSPEYMGALNYQTFDPDDGDKIMGAAMMQNNLMVFKRHRTWLCDVYSMSTTDGVSSIAKHVLSPTIGCIASGSIQSVDTESCIWLSSEGVMLYAGGEIKNISKDRINSVINFYMAHGAEPYVDSIYHSTRRQYHINFLYRNDAGTAIVAQRHFIYSLDSDSWTEYVYRSTTGTRFYEINFCLASDSNMNEVILIGYVSSLTGEIGYIYQSDYEILWDFNETSLKIMNSTGDGVTALDMPDYTVTDIEHNVYILASYTGTSAVIFKVAPDGTKSVLVTNAQINAECDFDPVSDGVHGVGVLVTSTDVIVDQTNRCFYALMYGYNTADADYHWSILRITFEGEIDLVKSYPRISTPLYGSTGVYHYLVLNSDGTKLYFLRENDHRDDTPPVNYVTHELWVITDMLTGSQAETLLYSSDTYEYYSTFTDPDGFSRVSTYGDYLYLGWNHSDDGTTFTHSILKFSMVTDTADEITLTNMDALAYAGHPVTILDPIVINDSLIYVIVGYHDPVADVDVGEFCKVSYDGSTWIDELTGVIPLNTNITSTLRKTNGDFITSYNSGMDLYDSNVLLKKSIVSTSGMPFTTPLGLSTLVGEQYVEEIIIFTDPGSNSVWEIWPDDFGNIIPSINGVVVNIVSNYDELGIANHKRVKRVYLDVESQYPSYGLFTLEPDYQMNLAVHTDGESVEPADATSYLTFSHVGQETWKYTNDQFDSAIEAWKAIRIDVGTQGTAFRYSIQLGDNPASNAGILRIRPPKCMAQILNFY